MTLRIEQKLKLKRTVLERRLIGIHALRTYPLERNGLQRAQSTAIVFWSPDNSSRVS